MYHPTPYRDPISRATAPVSSVAGLDDTTRPGPPGQVLHGHYLIYFAPRRKLLTLPTKFNQVTYLNGLPAMLRLQVS
jgi:hypothetical protein